MNWSVLVMQKELSGKGFEYIDHDPLPMVDVRLNGVPISICDLVKIAEQMRLELWRYGVMVKIKCEDEHGKPIQHD